jgi:S-adenosylmethionine/arginine decarboxylase-like enzyme
MGKRNTAVTSPKNPASVSTAKRHCETSTGINCRGKIDWGEKMHALNQIRSVSKTQSFNESETQTAPQVWGIASSIDIYNCDPKKIRDAGEIRRFVAELCDLIKMKRFGETQVVHFGEEERVAGFSMIQLIETSLISAHFANLTNAVYLDVFSCKLYDSEAVRAFSQDFFGGSHSILHVTLRR